MKSKLLYSSCLAFLLLIITATTLKGQYGAQLTFSEVMFYQVETNGEFIEIYNTSTTETIDLTGFKFKYYTSSNDNFASFIGGMKLAPGKFAVVIENDYDYTNGILKTLIPADAIVLKISDSAFGTSGMANETSRDIYLINAANQTVDTYIYSAGTTAADNKAGYSDEKVILDKSNAASNWKNSLKLNGSPGAKNSVSPVDFDLRVTFTGVIPAEPKVEDTVKVSALVKNIGRLAAANFSVVIFNDANYDSIGLPSESIFSNTYTNLASGDSIIIQAKIYLSTAGSYSLFANITYDQDENMLNNRAFFKFTTVEKPAATNEIVINEIMYAPTNDEPEWLELFNRSNRPLNLKNWKVGDKTSTPTISTTDYILNPGEYLVISSDATITNFHQISSKLLIRALPSLSNTGDDVILRSNTGSTIDSLKYLPSWGGSTGGKSLERISVNSPSTEQTNWKTSISSTRATPGRINSVSQRDYDLNVKSFTANVKFAEMGTSIKLRVLVENIGKSAARFFSVKLFNDSNFNSIEESDEFVAEIPGWNHQPEAGIIYEFTTTNFFFGLNQFISKIEFAEDEYTENNKALLKINGVRLTEFSGELLVNEIMYAPNSPEPEWIEIYNNSSKQINLKGYQLAAESGKNKVVSKDLFINPEEYFVITRDSSMFSRYPGSPKFTLALFPTLNNTKDKIILLDSLDRAIDSLEYKSSWGGSKGKSLERIDFAKASIDSTNWKTSGSILGATPGFINSVSKKKYDIAVTTITFTPQSPLAGDRVKIRAEAVNFGKNDAAFRLILNQVNIDGSKQKREETSIIILVSGNSITFEFDFAIASILLKHTFEIVADCSDDEDLTNNSLTAVIRPGYKPQTVLLNEIMYNPLNGEPEWIELYNNSSFDVDLEDWSIIDVLTTPAKTKIKSKDYIFPVRSFLVVSKDSTIKNFHREVPSKLIISTFANLNNDADGVVIKDSRDVTIDSMRYDRTWGGESGRSLERKQMSVLTTDKANWGSSKDIELSTPGRINSIAVKKFDLTIKSIVSSPLFPVLGDEVLIGAKLFNNGTNSAENFTVSIYLKSNNNFVLFSETKGTSLAAYDSTVLLSNLRLKLNETKTIMCRVFFTADEDTMNNTITGDIIPGAKRNTLLISEVMYDPLPNESEWIEIVNASNEAVNLKNWSVSDLLTTPTKNFITTKDNFLNPDEYAVITSDSNKFFYVPPKKFFQVKFGTLGNTSDGVLIYDFKNAVIDSLSYRSSWGGGKGFSLEKIALTSATNDSLNWTTSLSKVSATPGLRNSVLNPSKYSIGALTLNEIMFDPAAGSSEFIEFYNTTDDSIQIGGMELRIGTRDRVKLSVSNTVIPPRQYFVLASDTLIYLNYPWLKNSRLVRVALFSLSNDGATLLIKDLLKITLDSTAYSPKWHNKNILITKNRSLERLNPFLNSNDGKNWSTSVSSEGATPGKPNSVFTQNLLRESKVTINPNPFSPDNDGFEDFAIINFDLTQPLSQVRIKVFDSAGRLVRTIADNRPSSSNNSIVFDGLDDNGKALRIGIYILLIEIIGADSTKEETIKTPIVIARKL